MKTSIAKRNIKTSKGHKITKGNKYSFIEYLTSQGQELIQIRLENRTSFNLPKTLFIKFFELN